MTPAERAIKRNRYASDPEFRAAYIAQVKARHERNAKDPDYCRLVQLRKTVTRLRDSRDSRLKQAALLDKRIVALGHELGKVHARWNEKKAKGANA